MAHKPHRARAARTQRWGDPTRRPFVFLYVSHGRDITTLHLKNRRFPGPRVPCVGLAPPDPASRIR